MINFVFVRLKFVILNKIGIEGICNCWLVMQWSTINKQYTDLAEWSVLQNN